MSGVLDTFVFLFEGDATGLKKGLNESKDIAKRVETNLSAVDKVASRVGNSFNQLIRQYGGLITAAFSAGAIISGIRNAAEYASSLDMASRSLNINVENLDAWGNAVKKNGGTAEGFQQTLKSLQTNEYFQTLGRRLTGVRGQIQDATTVFPRLAELFERLGKHKSGLLGEKIGLDQGTITLLQQGRREVDSVIARQKELGVVTARDAEIAKKFNDQWDNTTQAFRTLFTSVNSLILPILTQLAKAFEKVASFFARHKDLIVGGLVAIGAVVAYFVAPAFATLLATLLPFLAIGAAIAGIVALFALIYDDIKTFEEGGDSLLGDIVKKWPAVAEVFKAIKEIVGWLTDAFLNIPNAIAEAWNFIIGIIKTAISAITGGIDAIEGAYNKVKSFLGLGDSSTDVNLLTAQKTLALAGGSPLGAQSSNSIVSGNRTANKNTTVNTGPITVETQATDAQGISTALGNSLDVQIRQAMNNFDDGVEA